MPLLHIVIYIIYLVTAMIEKNTFKNNFPNLELNHIFEIL